MKKTGSGIAVIGILVACPVVASLSSAASAAAGKGPVKVFILAGQSNMVGVGHVELL